MVQFDKNTIPKVENIVYSKINIIEKYLKIREKYSKLYDIPAFKKTEIINTFKELDYKVNYIKGGAYVIERNEKEYKFQLSTVIRYNSPIFYIYIYKEEQLIGPKVTNLAFLMNYYEYDKTLINKSFGLNSLDDLKKYIFDILSLFNEFVDEYMKEL